MKLTMKHYYYFGESAKVIGKSLIQSQAWDTLRTAQNGSQDIFSMPEDRTTWLAKSLNNTVLHKRAEAVNDFLKVKYRRVYSYGVGGALLEYLLKKRDPTLFLRCSDFTPRTIERLKKVFTEADEIVLFDMLTDPWDDGGPSCIHLFYRVDPEFDDRQWRGILKKMSAAGIEHILFIPSEFLTLKRIIVQKVKYALYPCLGKRMTFSGYLRSRQCFISLLSEFYDIVQTVETGDLTGLLLQLKKQNK